MSQAGIELSVVVATRNRASSIRRLLLGLADQADAPPFEVVVGDNGSRDHTPAVIDELQDRLTVRYVRIDQPGKGRALNGALAITSGDLVVFTDDDVCPDSHWLRHLSDAAREFPDCNVFGGRIRVNRDHVPAWIRKSFNLTGLLTSAHDVAPVCTRYGYAEYPFGPNMAIRRRLLKGLPRPYPEDMGPGTTQPVGDETCFLLPLSPPDATDRLFVPAAGVMHEVEKENVAFHTALRRCFQAGRAHGLVGLPPVAHGEHPENSTPVLMVQRLRSCRSLRELACITVRYLGYLQGRRRRAWPEQG